MTGLFSQIKPNSLSLIRVNIQANAPQLPGDWHSDRRVSQKWGVREKKINKLINGEKSGVRGGQ